MVAFVTVTVQLAFLPPSAVVAVITASPAETAVTLPFESTFATFVLLDAQATALFVALAGRTVAVRLSLLPVINAIVFLFKLMLATLTACLPLLIHTVTVPPSTSDVPALGSWLITCPAGTVSL